MFVPERKYVTDALVSMLADVTSMPIGDSRIPYPSDDPSSDPELPYVIVYSVDGGGFSGPTYTTTEDTATFLYVIHSVAGNDDREQAEWAADRVRHAILGVNAAGAYLHDLELVQPVGHVPQRVIGRRPEGPPGGVDTSATLATAVDRYLIEVNASG